MCGILGFVDVRAQIADPEQLIQKMASVLAHRGPDGSGFWHDSERGIALGHTRLSIFDLSANGAQPMESHSGRFILTFNGEIYNFQQLKCELPNYPFRSNSDTEVLLALIEEFGLEATLRKIVGMFAFVIFDRAEQEFFLCRDRFGEKPLYFEFNQGLLVFGSEPKVLKVCHVSKRTIDQQSLATYFRYGYVPEPRSIFEGVSKVPKGSFIRISYLKDRLVQHEAEPYWKAIYCFQQEIETDRNADEDLERLLLDSISKQAQADVSVGCFLSGGIDSSLISALMQETSSSRIHTYNAKFNNETYDESAVAEAVANHIGSDHTVVPIANDDLSAAIHDVGRIYCEPFADSSQIPTLALARKVRQETTVILSGDGGDELFGGYNRHIYAKYFGLLKCGGRFMDAVSPKLLAGGLSKVQTLFFGGVDRELRTRKILEMVRCRDMAEYLDHLWAIPGSDEVKFLTGDPKPAALAGLLPDSSHFRSAVDWLCNCDIEIYLVNDILTKVDRATMSTGLETRAPFLDHRILEFAARLPVSQKVKGREGKVILKKLLKKRMPDYDFQRPKAGFAAPLDDWIMVDLRDWAEHHLSQASLVSSGLLEHLPISEIWASYKAGRRELRTVIWSVLMFQCWFEANMDRR